MADFNFSKKQNDFFGSARGAYSTVTATERGDQQITVTGSEKVIFKDFLKSFERGPIHAATAPGKQFRLFPTGELITLNVNHPKWKGGELRLYLQGNLFLPNSTDVWFVFEKKGELWIGSLDRYSFDKIEVTEEATVDKNSIVDLSDDEYNASLELPDKPETIEKIIRQTKRDPRIAKKIIASAKHCEMLPTLPNFISKHTGRVFLEAHHLIPISIQSRFEKSLDVESNIVALNPYSHRMIHHAKFSEIEGYLENLCKSREKFLKAIGKNANFVLDLYAGRLA